MSDAFVFRPGTLDEVIFRHFQEHNEYEMPESFGPRRRWWTSAFTSADSATRP